LYSNDREGMLKERLDRFKRLRDILSDRIEKSASMITNEMGKPIKEARGEIDKGINLI
jgi:acyl-CoA reductase-like NAD-dependent aldehyde dehydrogenase